MKFTYFYSQGLWLLGLRRVRADRVKKGLRDRAIRVWQGYRAVRVGQG